MIDTDYRIEALNLLLNEDCLMAIKEYEMSCIVPLPKEVRTHIAVAKAFLYGNQLKSI